MPSYKTSPKSVTTRKYIVDISGQLPTILCEINTSDSSLTKSYIYSDRQILCQRDGGASAGEYFYVTDRLGSVRQVVNNAGAVVLNYTYSPFGQTLEQSKATGFEYSFNNFMFTGQWYDTEFSQYYLRARMYDPALGRFTTRDPVEGKYKKPITLHKYLYCQNNPLNRIDLTGRFSTSEISITNGIIGGLLGGLFGGTVNEIFGDGSFTTGFIAGGLGAGVPAFFGSYGLAAAVYGGGISSGTSAILDKSSTEQVLAHTLAGMAIGSIMYGITNWSIDNFMYANLIPDDMTKSFHAMFDPLMGESGGSIETAISIYINQKSANTPDETNP